MFIFGQHFKKPLFEIVTPHTCRIGSWVDYKHRIFEKLQMTKSKNFNLFVTVLSAVTRVAEIWIVALKNVCAAVSSWHFLTLKYCDWRAVIIGGASLILDGQVSGIKLIIELVPEETAS